MARMTSFWLIYDVVDKLVFTISVSPLNFLYDNYYFFIKHVSPVWLCPHGLYKHPYKTMMYPDPGFKQERKQVTLHTRRCTHILGSTIRAGPENSCTLFELEKRALRS
ncbi:putative delta(24)-sterol reductase [Helianthus anomalus]